MARRSERKTRHRRPYEEWGRPTPFDQLVDLVRQATGRYPESAYGDLPVAGQHKCVDGGEK